MGSAVSFYEQLVNTEDDRVRMRLIAEALEALRTQPLPDHVATSEQLRETELRLQKEIEQVRAELKHDIAQAKVDMLKWASGLFMLQGAAIVGALAAILG